VHGLLLSGSYINGIALAECFLVQQASVPAVVEWIFTWGRWYGKVRNLLKKCQQSWSTLLESGCVGDA
jgi:hypothetical protein